MKYLLEVSQSIKINMKPQCDIIIGHMRRAVVIGESIFVIYVIL